MAKESSESYQELRIRLDAVMLKLQDPDCDVDEGVALYEEALGLANKLEQHLESAENRISKIKADFGISTTVTES